MPAGAIREIRRWQGFDTERMPIVCPAGLPYSDVMKGASCHCRVEDSEITSVDQPSSLISFCMGVYTQCPSWRMEKENRWVQLRARDMNHAPRSRQTILDQDPEQVPHFFVPRD